VKVVSSGSRAQVHDTVSREPFCRQRVVYVHRERFEMIPVYAVAPLVRACTRVGKKDSFPSREKEVAVPFVRGTKSRAIDAFIVSIARH